MLDYPIKRYLRINRLQKTSILDFRDNYHDVTPPSYTTTRDPSELKNQISVFKTFFLTFFDEDFEDITLATFLA